MLVLPAAIQRRNSLVPVNQFPLDVLLLTPVHLTSLNDRLRVTFVCRRWRRPFLQHAPLWSQLYLDGNTDRHLFTTLLRRVMRAPLDITVDHSSSLVHDVTLFSPFARQIRSITLKGARTNQVQNLSVAIFGPLPLLHRLEIDARRPTNVPDPSTTPIPSLFEHATNLKKFSLSINRYSSLSHFAFANLTTFDFTAWSISFSISHLLDFLEDSHTLQSTQMNIAAYFLEEGTPRKRSSSFPMSKPFASSSYTAPGVAKLRSVFHVPPQSIRCFIIVWLTATSPKASTLRHIHYAQSFVNTQKSLSAKLHLISHQTGTTPLTAYSGSSHPTRPCLDRSILIILTKVRITRARPPTRDSSKFSHRLQGRYETTHQWLPSGTSLFDVGASIRATSGLPPMTMGDSWDPSDYWSG